MPEHFVLNPEFKPVLLAGQTAALHIDNSTVYDVKVRAVRPISVHRHDFGTIAADTLAQECTHIEMLTGELGQFRYVARGRFEVVLMNPNGMDVYRTSGSIKNTRAEAFRMPPWALGLADSDPKQLLDTYWLMSEFFVLESTTPRWDLFPFAPLNGIEAYVDIFGLNYALESLPAGSKGMVDIWVRGWPAGESLVARR